MKIIAGTKKITVTIKDDRRMFELASLKVINAAKAAFNISSDGQSNLLDWCVDTCDIVIQFESYRMRGNKKDGWSFVFEYTAWIENHVL